MLEARNQGMEVHNQELIRKHQGLLEVLTFRCATLESKLLDCENRNQTLLANLKGLADTRAHLEQEKCDDAVKIEEIRMDRDDLQKEVDSLKEKLQVIKDQRAEDL